MDFRIGDLVERAEPVVVHSCSCRGCWRSHNQGTILSVDEHTVLVSFGYSEMFRPGALRLVNPIEALARLEEGAR